ncbi:MAG TPA: hypothetical protein VFU11_02175 [Solirubrobacterales bacterium]|nr:hypothetical protein [Solirubrobacterales bacterium]
MINTSYPFSQVGPKFRVSVKNSTIKVTHFIHFVTGVGEEEDEPLIATIKPPADGFTGPVILIGQESEPGVGPVQIQGPGEGGTNIGGGAQVTPNSALILVYDGSLWWPNRGT